MISLLVDEDGLYDIPLGYSVQSLRKRKMGGIESRYYQKKVKGFDELYKIIAVFICMFEESVPTIFYT